MNYVAPHALLPVPACPSHSFVPPCARKGVNVMMASSSVATSVCHPSPVDATTRAATDKAASSSGMARNVRACVPVMAPPDQSVVHRVPAPPRSPVVLWKVTSAATQTHMAHVPHLGTPTTSPLTVEPMTFREPAATFWPPRATPPVGYITFRWRARMSHGTGCLFQSQLRCMSVCGVTGCICQGNNVVWYK